MDIRIRHVHHFFLMLEIIHLLSQRCFCQYELLHLPASRTTSSCIPPIPPGAASPASESRPAIGLIIPASWTYGVIISTFCLSTGTVSRTTTVSRIEASMGLQPPPHPYHYFKVFNFHPETLDDCGIFHPEPLVLVECQPQCLGVERHRDRIHPHVLHLRKQRVLFDW